MRLERWLSLAWLLITISSSVQASSRLAKHVERLKHAWKAAERMGNLSAARVLCHFSQARQSANKLLAKFARQGDVESMQLLAAIPLLDFNTVLGVAAEAGQEEAMVFVAMYGGDELDFNAALLLAAGGSDDDKALIAVRYLVEQQQASELAAAEQIAREQQNYQTAQYLRDLNDVMQSKIPH